MKARTSVRRGPNRSVVVVIDNCEFTLSPPTFFTFVQQLVRVCASIEKDETK